MSVIHRCPLGDSGVMPCCGGQPTEVPHGDRITVAPELVTCTGAAVGSGRTVVHDPGGLGVVVREVFVFLVVHGDGDEAIPAVMIGGRWMPLVAAERERVEDMRPFAVQAAAASGKPVRLARFTTRTDLEVIRP